MLPIKKAETPLNTLTRSFLFLVLLGSAIVLLPACGSKSSVKSQNASETVLNAEPTPTTSGNQNIGIPGENTSINTYVNGGTVEKSYVRKIHRTKGPRSTTTITTTPVTTSAPTPVATVATPPKTLQVEAPPPVKKSHGFSWLLWLLVILVLAGVGWYFWNKSQENHPPTAPMPPTGGLSPVSGFTAIKGKIEGQEAPKPSIWSKKIF